MLEENFSNAEARNYKNIPKNYGNELNLRVN